MDKPGNSAHKQNRVTRVKELDKGQKISKITSLIDYREILTLFVVGMVVFLSSKSAYAELTKQDIEEIRKIVKEEVQILRQETQTGFVYVNKRIEDLETSVNKRIEDLETSVNRQMENSEKSLNKRIEDVRGLLYVILAGIFTLSGFVLWDRRTAITPAVKKTNMLEEKEERLERALKEFALKEPRLAEALRYAGVV